jgi:hypothetical protein
MQAWESISAAAVLWAQPIWTSEVIGERHRIETPVAPPPQAVARN